MTEQMDKIWDAAQDSIQFRTDDAGDYTFTTSYHGSGRFLIGIDQHGESAIHVSLHASRDQLTTLADMIATALGGCLYIAGEDSDSEL
jgi:hypothetical protein